MRQNAANCLLTSFFGRSPVPAEKCAEKEVRYQSCAKACTRFPVKMIRSEKKPVDSEKIGKSPVDGFWKRPGFGLISPLIYRDYARPHHGYRCPSRDRPLPRGARRSLEIAASNVSRPLPRAAVSYTTMAPVNCWYCKSLSEFHRLSQIIVFSSMHFSFQVLQIEPAIR